MPDIFSSAEQFWDNILSGNPDQILKAFRGLDEPSRFAVLRHLNAMVGEEGWLPQQRESARKALEAINRPS